MSVEITTAFVEQYGANIDLLSQQMDMRLAGTVREEPVNGESAFFEQVGSSDVVEATSRHDDTPRIDIPHARRMVVMRTFRHADLIDNADKVRMLIDPTSTYARTQAMAMNRKRDKVLIDAATASALTGKTGTTSVALPSTQKVPIATATSLTLAKLLLAKEILDGNDVDEMIPRHIVCSSKEFTSLLGTAEIKSADYNTIKALVQGDVDTFLGFKFHRSEQLNLDANADRQVIAWAEDGLLLGRGSGAKNPVTRIDERSDKNYSVQVFREEYFGATRMEEKKVVEIACAP